ncbi:rhomboid-like protein [Amycolatopsis silviterrae]|uniref:Rhomboid-like protein n=1 Tax=Amycolatopsis silviterrae TaxID=1656914 RepID=A0ABW5H2R2_9PSEU
MPSHSGRMSPREPDPEPRPARDAATPRKWRSFPWPREQVLEPAASGTPSAGITGASTAVLTKAEPTPASAFLSAWRPKRAWLGLIPTPRSTPFTFGYLVLLLGTSLLIRFGSPTFTDKLLAVSSTDAHNMARHPLTALLTSAFWIADGGWLPYAVIFAIAVAPLERRFGGLRTAVVFFTGHVLATIATELPVMALIHTDVLPHSAGHWLDIGVSYGFLTTAGALVALLSGRARIAGIAALELFVIGVYVTDDPASLASVVTVLGHACAAHFGLLGWGPRLRSVPRIAR